MGKKLFDIDEGYKRIEELECAKESVRSEAELKILNREIRKIKEKIYAEEDRQAQEYFNDPENIARDEAMKQSNKDAMDRWRAEHPGVQCYAEPNKEE